MSDWYGPLCLIAGSALAFLTFSYARPQENYINYPLSVQAMRSDGQYLVPGNYQASLEPRFSNVGYGPVMNQFGTAQQLGRDVSGVPFHPLGNPNTPVKEGYTAPQQISPAMSTHEIQNNSPPSRTPIVLTDALQVSPAQVQQFAASNNVSNPYAEDQAQHRAVYDRLVYSTKLTRQYSMGDPIRGDLAIVPILPDSNPSAAVWMRPSASIESDLRPGGAMAMVGASDAAARLQQLKMMANPAHRQLGATSDGSLVTNKNPVLYGQGLADLQLNVQRFV